MILEHPIELDEEHVVCVLIVNGQASTSDLVVQDGKAMLGLKGVRIEFPEFPPSFPAVRRGSEVSYDLDPFPGRS
jgi:hypothetical protein